MVNKSIDVIYRPWEEKEENLRYKEERKKAEKQAEILEKEEKIQLENLIANLRMNFIEKTKDKDKDKFGENNSDKEKKE